MRNNNKYWYARIGDLKYFDRALFEYLKREVNFKK